MEQNSINTVIKTISSEITVLIKERRKLQDKIQIRQQSLKLIRKTFREQLTVK